MVSTSFNSLSHVQSSGVLKMAANFSHICLFQHSLCVLSVALRKLLARIKGQVCTWTKGIFILKGFLFSFILLLVFIFYLFLFQCPVTSNLK